MAPRCCNEKEDRPFSTTATRDALFSVVELATHCLLRRLARSHRPRCLYLGGTSWVTWATIPLRDRRKAGSGS